MGLRHPPGRLSRPAPAGTGPPRRPGPSHPHRRLAIPSSRWKTARPRAAVRNRIRRSWSRPNWWRTRKRMPSSPRAIPAPPWRPPSGTCAGSPHVSRPAITTFLPTLNGLLRPGGCRRQRRLQAQAPPAVRHHGPPGDEVRFRPRKSQESGSSPSAKSRARATSSRWPPPSSCASMSPILSATWKAAIFPKAMVDVVVCDGFVGNIVLKFAEGLAEALVSLIKEQISSNPSGQTGRAFHEELAQRSEEKDRLRRIRRGAASGRQRRLHHLPRQIEPEGDHQRHSRRRPVCEKRHEPPDPGRNPEAPCRKRSLRRAPKVHLTV